jgi:UDP-N-acetylmuramoyl-tripeptide--D-alanyl-D-alanine ligase
MTIWSPCSLKEALGVETSVKGNAVRLNSQEMQNGDIFITLPSQDGDQRAFQYINHAFEMGASGCITEFCEQTSHYPSEKMIYVENSLQSLQKLAQYKRQKSSATFVAVTGTSGKTTVKEIIYQLVASSKKTFVGYQNFNNNLGVQLNLASMPDDVACAILELGMSAKNEIRHLTSMVRHKIAVITNVGPGHLANFNNVEEIAEAKAEIFENMSREGIAILPQSSDHFPFLKRKASEQNLKIYQYGYASGADAQILSTSWDYAGTKCKIRILEEEVDLHIPLHGNHHVHNVAASLLCARLLNADMNKSLMVAKQILLPQQRGRKFTVKLGKKNIDILDKSYNANPLSVRATLEELKAIEGRKILVLGDMLELGENSVLYHTYLGQDIINAQIDKVVTIGTQTKYLYDILPSYMQLLHAKSSDEVVPQIINHLEDKDTLVVQGSKSIKTKQVILSLIAHSSGA